MLTALEKLLALVKSGYGVLGLSRDVWKERFIKRMGDVSGGLFPFPGS